MPKTKTPKEPKPKPFKITLKSRKLWIIKGFSAFSGCAEEAFAECLDGQLYTSEALACHAAEKFAVAGHGKIYRNGETPTEEELEDNIQWIAIDSLNINTDGLG